MDPPTILAIKQAFLASAVRRLDQPLTPSRAWRQRSSSSSSAAAASAQAAADRLPSKAVDAALDRVNHRLHQHARRVYAPAAVRHVAEQIDRLYGDQGDDLRRPVASSSATATATTTAAAGAPNYTDPAVLDALPTAWHDHDPAAADALPLEARRYAELVARLRALAAERAAAVRRVQQLRRLAAVAGPFAIADEDKDEDRKRQLQNGLVTRDGAVEAELERMRVLLARVGGRVAALSTTPAAPTTTPSTTTATTTTTTTTEGSSKTVEDASRQRVQALLEQL